jgi:hypothetical protein
VLEPTKPAKPPAFNDFVTERLHRAADRRMKGASTPFSKYRWKTSVVNRWISPDARGMVRTPATSEGCGQISVTARASSVSFVLTHQIVGN